MARAKRVRIPIDVYKPQKYFIDWLENAKRNTSSGQDNIKTTLDAFLDFKTEYYNQAKSEKRRIVLSTIGCFLGIGAVPAATVALILLAMTKDFMGDFIFVPIIALLIIGISALVATIKGFFTNLFSIFSVVLRKEWMNSELYRVLRDNVVNPLSAVQAGMTYVKDEIASSLDDVAVYSYLGQIGEYHTSIVEYPAGTQLHISSPSLSFGEEVFVVNKHEIREEGHSFNLIRNIDHPEFASKYDVYCDDVKHAFSVLSLKRMELLSNNILGVNKVEFRDCVIHIDIKKHFDRIEPYELTDKNTTTDLETFTKIINENAKKITEFRSAFLALTKE